MNETELMEQGSDPELYLAELTEEMLDTARIRRNLAADLEEPEDLARQLAAAADRLEDLAGATDDIPPALLAEFAAAFEKDGELHGQDYAGDILVSMVTEIGFLLFPNNIVELCRLYIDAVERYNSHRDPSWETLYEFWVEFPANRL